MNEPIQTADTLSRAEQFFDAGDYEQALAMLSNLYDQELPSSVRGRGLALEVVCLERLDRREESDNLIVDVMKEEGDDLAFVQAAGMEFSDLESDIHAETFLQNLCDLDSDDAQNWYYLAIALGRTERYHESLQAYDECLKHDPAFPGAHVEKAWCLKHMGDVDGAIAAYRAYLAIEPGDGGTWKTVAIAEGDRGNYEASYEAFDKALATGEDAEDVYYNRATSAMRQGDEDEVQRCIEELQEIDPESWRTLLTRADYEEAQGHIWPAWELLGEAFDGAIDDQDEEDDPEVDLGERNYIAGALLRYAVRNGMQDHASQYVLQIFENDLFSDEVLTELRALDGRFANAVANFQVVLRGATESSGERWVVYAVSAENADAAGDEATAFHERYGAPDWQLESTQQISGVDEGPVGVYWRSDELSTPPRSATQSR